MKGIIRLVASFTLVGLTVSSSLAQNNGAIISGQDSTRRVITTAVPFLNITPDARGGGMADAAGALSADPNATYWNPANLANNEHTFGVALSYTPWLSKIVDDMSLSYLTGYYKIDPMQAIGFSFYYFDLGDIQLTEEAPGGGPQELGLFSPREFALAFTYSRKLNQNLSIGATGRFIHSNISTTIATPEAKAGTSVAVDLGIFHNKEFRLSGKNSKLALAAAITNIGAKMTYNDSESKDFLPINLNLAGAFTTNLDPYNSLTFDLDFNKLLVPSPPIYATNPDGSIATDANGDPIIESGEDPDRSLLGGMFGSFTDAPGGFSEEMQEIIIAFGMEYWYKEFFAARAGYHYENANKGNRKYFAMGVGLRYQKFGVDFAYMIPTEKNHPLAETLRFTLQFNFDKEAKPSVTSSPAQ